MKVKIYKSMLQFVCNIQIVAFAYFYYNYFYYRLENCRLKTSAEESDVFE